MTRKHFEEIAAVFNNKLRDYPDDPVRRACLRDVAAGLCGTFAKANPQFDRRRFMDACGFDPDQD